MTVADLNNISAKDFEGFDYLADNDRPIRCFNCGGTLDRIFVLPDGVGPSPYSGFHPKCAIALGETLIRDGMTAEIIITSGLDPVACYGIIASLRRPR